MDRILLGLLLLIIAFTAKDGGNIRQLIDHEFSSTNPAWSPEVTLETADRFCDQGKRQTDRWLNTPGMNLY